MAEYIEREAAIRKINGEFPDAHYPSWYAALLEEVPAADVVEVVRCKDCKYRGWVQEPCHGKTVHYCKLTENRVEDNNFCSYGERRESDDN